MTRTISITDAEVNPAPDSEVQLVRLLRERRQAPRPTYGELPRDSISGRSRITPLSARRSKI